MKVSTRRYIGFIIHWYNLSIWFCLYKLGYKLIGVLIGPYTGFKEYVGE